MKKPFTKIICVAVSAISALSIIGAAGCSKYHKSTALGGDYSGEVSSNGGFAVEKGGYVYFINGVESNTANNEFGTPVKGGIYRISTENLNKNSYSSAECVVPSVIYSGNTNAGIFIYGDYVYYSTPSTAVDVDGVVQNSALDMKRTKLDGTETLKDDQFIRFTDNSYDFRYVEKNNTVYLMYVATGDKHFDESTGVTNLYSLNTATGANTLLAYNIDSYAFDGADKTNPRVYYTMKVRDYYNSADCKYNQLYTVEADATEDKFKDKLNSDNVLGWKEDSDHYVNCGDLVYDGIGNNDTPGVFNYNGGENLTVDRTSYSYGISKYQNGVLFYTRTTPNNSNQYLFSFADGTAYNPVAGNPDASARLLSDGSNANGYYYLFNSDKTVKAALIVESAGLSVNYAYRENGNLKLNTQISNTHGSEYFNLLREGTVTILFVDGDYLYYSLSGESGYTVHRINYTGEADNYLPLPAGEGDYTSVKILDIVADSDWYMPELLQNQLFFASETTNMTDYNYVMACDLRGANGIMTNAEIKAMNELYEGIEDIITDTYGDTDKYPSDTYANLQSALRYAFYTGEDKSVYLLGQQKECNAPLKEDEPRVYSDRTIELYDAFLNAEGEWAEDYAGKTKTVNGETVHANRLAYYYSVVGKMSDKDGSAYLEKLRTTYILSVDEEETTWWQGLSTAAKVWFIIGMVAAGLVVAGGITVAVILIVRHKKKKHPQETRRRIKVDTTDDKDIDVYGDADGENKQE